MKMTSREVRLGLVTLAVALFGVSALLARPKVEEWKRLRQQEREILSQIEENRKLVDEREQWAQRLAELTQQLPKIPADRKMDIHWLSEMDRLATQNGLKIAKRQAGEEKQIGDIYELSIECKDWEGTLESLVHFLFDLESEGAMFDVRQLRITPKGARVLRGYFSLSCAYMREEKPGKP